jgi:diguanylate cyclase (GGDEF)-like protein/PAS domain S-box-containing protein
VTSARSRSRREDEVVDLGVDPARRRVALLDLLPDALFLLDADLRVLDDNGVGRRWLGSPPAADWLDRIHPDDQPVAVVLAAEARAAEPGWSEPVPLRLRHVDGSWRTWSISTDNRLADPELGALVVRARDVTSRPWVRGGQVDGLLRELAQQAPMAFCTVDSAGRVSLAGGAALAVPAAELVGRPLAEVFESEEQRAILSRALAGESVDEITAWDRRWWQVRYTPLKREGALAGAVGIFLDVSERVTAERALALSETHLRGVLDAVQEPLVVVDADGVLTTCNDRFRALTGDTAVAGARLREVVVPALAVLVEEVCGDSHRRRREVRLTDPDGQPVWLLASANALRAEDGAVVGCVAVLTDISAQKEAERRLELQARTDPLTGAGTRATLVERLDQALSRREGVAALLFCDVDELKAVNDRLGHAAGDALLREVAGRIRSALRPADTLVRYGGDELVVVCDELGGAPEAVAVAERVRRAVARPLSLDGQEITPTVSVGVATAPPARRSAELLASADAAAYAAKAAGRDSVRAVD